MYDANMVALVLGLGLGFRVRLRPGFTVRVSSVSSVGLGFATMSASYTRQWWPAVY